MASRWRSSIPVWSLLGCFGLAATVGAATPAAWTDDLAPIPADGWNYARAAHLLERAGFGATPERDRRASPR